MSQGIKKHSDYMKAIPQRAIDVQGQIAPNIEFKKPYDYHPNTAQMIHYYANNLRYFGGDPVPPLSDPSLLPHAPVLVVAAVDAMAIYYPKASGDDGYYSGPDYPAFFNNNDTSTILGTTTGIADSRAFIRFPNIENQAGKKLVSAFLYLTVSFAAGGQAIRIYMNASRNAVAPTSHAEGSALQYTGGSILYTQPTATGLSKTPNLASLVNEVGISDNGALMFIFTPTIAGYNTAFNRVYTFDNGSLSPKLELNWA